jgi:hypothetical protein
MTSITTLKNSMHAVRDHPKSPWARKTSNETAIYETELENLHNKGVPKHQETLNGFDPPPPYMPEAGPVFEEPLPPPQFTMTSAIPEELIEGAEESQPDPKWPESRSRKILRTILVVYSTFRAAAAFVVNIQGLIDMHTSASAPSNLLLLLVSIQIQTANYSIHRLVGMVLTLDILLVSVAFATTSFACYSNAHNYPAYAQLALAGGTCPFYMGDCHWQATHWDVVGCGNYTGLYDSNDPDQDNPAPTGFFEPYTLQGTLNSKMNRLVAVEVIAIVFGSIWLLTAIFQIYEARYLVTPRKGKGRDRYINGKERQPCGVAITGMTALFGVMGAFVGTFM